MCWRWRVGSEIEEIDAFDEIVESVSLPVPEGLGSKIRRNRRKQRKMCAGAGAKGGGGQKSKKSSLLTKSTKYKIVESASFPVPECGVSRN